MIRGLPNNHNFFKGTLTDQVKNLLKVSTTDQVFLFELKELLKKWDTAHLDLCSQYIQLLEVVENAKQTQP